MNKKYISGLYLSIIKPHRHEKWAKQHSRPIKDNYLYNKIDENPYSIICFYNYDKAGRIIRNLVDSMISNGYISNMNNEKVYLNNSIIFVFNNEETSRIGFNELVA